jgi:hypothetical protein
LLFKLLTLFLDIYSQAAFFLKLIFYCLPCQTETKLNFSKLQHNLENPLNPWLPLNGNWLIPVEAEGFCILLLVTPVINSNEVLDSIPSVFKFLTRKTCIQVYANLQIIAKEPTLKRKNYWHWQLAVAYRITTKSNTRLLLSFDRSSSKCARRPHSYLSSTSMLLLQASDNDCTT